MHNAKYIFISLLLPLTTFAYTLTFTPSSGTLPFTPTYTVANDADSYLYKQSASSTPFCTGVTHTGSGQPLSDFCTSGGPYNSSTAETYFGIAVFNNLCTGLSYNDCVATNTNRATDQFTVNPTTSAPSATFTVMSTTTDMVLRRFFESQFLIELLIIGAVVAWIMILTVKRK